VAVEPNTLSNAPVPVQLTFRVADAFVTAAACPDRPGETAKPDGRLLGNADACRQGVTQRRR